MDEFVVSRLSFRTFCEVGRIAPDGASFTYSSSYLSDPSAIPLSASLPLRADPFSPAEFRPYFEGLLAEGTARQALASELQLPQEDYLALLAACGRDCIGDVVVERASDRSARVDSGYIPVPEQELRTMLLDRSSTSAENAAQRLSLAGTQGKVGLARRPDAEPLEWLRPHGLAATTHIVKTSHLRDIPEIEYLCMKAATACGVAAAHVELVPTGMPAISVARFDRIVTSDKGKLHVERLHQEDFAQAFGLLPGSKYAELPGGTVEAIAAHIRMHCTQPARDLAAFARTLLFSFLIGNCDAHLKNYSLLYRPSGKRQTPSVSLAPAYDLVSTTIFPRFSRDMAMSVGGARAIDGVDATTLAELAGQLGITARALRKLARAIADSAPDAISNAGKGAYGSVLESTPYLADDLLEDIAPRLAVLEAFCRG